MSTSSQERWLAAWYGGRRWTYWLFPLNWLFRALTGLRRWWLCRFAQGRVAVPLLVVGNITLGGTGKTPLLLALLEHLKARGLNPGVISRGYGGSAPVYPYQLNPRSTAAEAGDEPLQIYQQTGCPVVVGPDRLACARQLEQLGCDLILSDDGLQHYKLGRDLEIVVVDGERGFGNGHCLPVGPLRESLSRLRQVDLLVVNGDLSKPLPEKSPSPYKMQLAPQRWRRLQDTAPLPLDHFAPGTRLHAVAGIGNPQRFYTTLEALGLSPQPRSFPDHHAYTPADLQFAEPLPLVMTAKDAVKCGGFAQADWYSLEVAARLPAEFWKVLDARLDLLLESSSQEHP
jgi:tetraacyldisaccharide 4'-kinase